MLTVDAPAVQPAKGGLLSVANVIPDNGRAGKEGVRFLARLTGVPQVVPGPGENKEFDRQTVISGTPFTIYRGVETNLFEALDVQVLADDVFTAGESLAVEAALQPVLNTVAQDFTPTPGTPVSVAEGVALAEEWIAERYSFLPILHMNRYGAAHTSSKGMIRLEDGRIETFQGTPVANGAGYGPVGPGAITATAGRYWIYVTGQVNLWQGPLVKAQAPALANNFERALAERTYVPVVDSPIGAVLVQA